METNAPAVRLTKMLIDFSAFVDATAAEEKKPTYIIKELTIVDIDSGCYQHWIYRPPKDSYHWAGTEPLQRHNQWQIERYHGLEFHVGLADYASLADSLNQHCNAANLLFAPNRVKADILEDLLYRNRTVFDLESLGCPPIPHVKHFPRSFASYDGVSVARFYDTVEGPREENRADEEEILTVPPCLYHRIAGGVFVCTRSRALYMASLCALNPSLIDMNDPAIRAKTFAGWKLSAPSAEDLAIAGFVRIRSAEGEGERTACVYCGFSTCEWKEGDDPDEEHEECKAPFCKLLRYRDQTRHAHGPSCACRPEKMNASELLSYGHKRRAEEVDCLIAGSDRSAHGPECACRSRKHIARPKFFRRYCNFPHVSLADVYEACRS